MKDQFVVGARKPEIESADDRAASARR